MQFIKIMPSPWRGFLLTLILLGTYSVGCNHVFYQPTDHQILDPTKAELTPQSEFVKTPDGETLGFWIFPGNKPTNGTVLHFHGNGENMSSHFAFFAWLTQFGFDLIVFDYRGYWQSSGTPTREGLVIDGKTALAFAERHAKKKNSPLYVVAQSLGGAVAVPSLATYSGPSPQALLLDSTFASYRDLARDILDGFWLSWPFQWPLSFLISTGWDAEDYAEKIRIPLVQVHGTKDSVVPIAHGRELFQAFTGTSKEFWVQPGGRHTEGFVSPESPFRPKLLAFFCKNHPTPNLCEENNRTHLRNNQVD